MTDFLNPNGSILLHSGSPPQTPPDEPPNPNTTTQLGVRRTDQSTHPNALADITMFGAGTANFQGVIALSTMNSGTSTGALVERMRVHTNGFVGIGTQAPTVALDVAGAVKATAFRGDGSALTGIIDASRVSKAGDTMTGTLNLPANGLKVGAQLVLADGRVGIGIAQPQAQLHVQGDATISGSLTLGAGKTISAPGRLHVSGDELLFLLNKSGVIVGKEWGGNGNLTVEGELNIASTIRSAGRMHLTGGELLYLLHKSGVIIGKEWGGTGDLTVEGNVAVGGELKIGSTLRSDGRMHLTGGELLYLLHKSGVIIGKEWGGNGNLTVEGFLDYGTLSKLEAADNFGATVACADFRIGHSSRRGSPGRALVDYTNSTLVLNYGADWTNVRIDGKHLNFSSAQYKEQIETLSIERAHAVLSGLRPVTFAFRGDPTKETQAGFIAEEVPELVGSSDRKAIAPVNILAVVTKVVQRQQETIERLERRIESMQGRERPPTHP